MRPALQVVGLFQSPSVMAVLVHRGVMCRVVVAGGPVRPVVLVA